MSAAQKRTVSTRPPRPDYILEAVRHLLEGLPVPDRYLHAILDLVEGEYARRAKARGRRG
jgi:hypothetical protein